MMVLRHDKE